MFSFGEIVVIIIVALVVLGPEKTHKLVRQVGLLAGRAKRYLRDLGDELEQETGARETMREFRNARNSFRDHANSFRENVVNFEREAKGTADEATSTSSDGENADPDDTTSAPEPLSADEALETLDAPAKLADTSTSADVTPKDSSQDSSARGQ